MSAPAKILETFDGRARYPRIDCDLLHIRTPEKFVELPLSGGRRNIEPRRQNHRRFQTNNARRHTSLRSLNFNLEAAPVRFESEDRYEDRGVKEDQ